MTTHPDAPRRPRARLRSFRAGLLALLVFACSLSLVVTTPTTAQALAQVTYPEPKTIGTKIDSLPSKGFNTAIKATPFGRFAKAWQIGSLLYDTKDIWWPVKDGANEATEETLSQKGIALDCVYSFGGLHTNILNMPSEGHVSGVVSYAGSKCNGTSNVRLKITTWNNGAAQTTETTLPMKQVTGTSTSTFQTATRLAGRVTQIIWNMAHSGSTTQWQEVLIMEPTPAPQWKQETTVNCRRADGSMFTLHTYTQGTPARIHVPSCRKTDPFSVPWETWIRGGPATGFQRDLIQITTRQDVFDEYADCFGTTGLKCSIRVHVDGQPCTFTDAGPCRYWKPLADDQPERVRCKFGSHVIALGDCDDLEKRYRPEIPNRPITEVDTEGVPKTDPDPAPTPTTGTGPAAPPMPTTGPNPNGPPTTPGVDTDPDSQNCFGQAWGWNPVDWVMVPVKCALQWAFIPKTSLSSRVATITGTMQTKLPFSLVGGLAAIPAGVPSGGCPDWRIKVGPLDQNVVCPSTYTDAVRAGRPIFAAMMATLALWPLIRSVAYASVPILSPSPGAGK